MPAFARTATRRTATGTGTCPSPGTGAARPGTARAWTRTGNRAKRGCCDPYLGAMRMDTAYYEELAGRLYGLLIGLDDRIGREQAQWLHHVIDVGEYGLALEDIAGILAHDAIAI